MEESVAKKEQSYKKLGNVMNILHAASSIPSWLSSSFLWKRSEPQGIQEVDWVCIEGIRCRAHWSSQARDV